MRPPKNARALASMLDDPAPGLVLESWDSSSLPFGVAVSHRRRDPSPATVAELRRLLGEGDPLSPFRSLYNAHDGVELCVHANGRLARERALLTLHPVADWERRTAVFQPGGAYAWTVAHNRYRGVPALYGADRWFVFATVDEDPACLTTFVSGPNAGCVFFLAPEARFNVTRPVARSLDAFLALVTEDLPALLHRFETQVSVAGPGGGHAGFPVARYVPDRRGHPDFHGRDPFAA